MFHLAGRLYNRTMNRSGVVFTIVTLLWIAAIGAGMLVLLKHDYTPGITKTPAIHWPYDSQLRLANSCPTLIMFAHPQCPCTRASITELARLIASCKTKFKAYVLLFEPTVTPEGWDKTALWYSAKAIPGVTVLRDMDGIEAQRFHSTTSGQTMIYNPQGDLLFNGGITISRGHEGDNLGFDLAKLAINTSRSSNSQTPVFGCSIVTLNKK